MSCSPCIVLGGLLFAAYEPVSIQEARTKANAILDVLPGHTGLAFTELTDESVKVLLGVRQDERFAVGSSFKLYILGTLAADVNLELRALENTMRLNPDLKGPPHSEVGTWPDRSPVTLQTLALKMISVSDNTATDHLHYLLRPERIERQMKRMGHQHPEWNTPLLNTRQMTMLRDRKTGLPGIEYAKLDVKGKRKYLAQRSGGRPDYEALDFDTAKFDLAEWYASPLDMARALAWLKRHTEKKSRAYPLREILAVEPKLPHDPTLWPYVGFKGGSEDQILAGNWLLQNQNGRWYTFHLFWNDPAGNTDPAKLLDAIAKILPVLEALIK